MNNDDNVIDAEIVDDSDLRSALPMVRPKARQWSQEWWEQTSPEVQAKRCKARNTKGERCQRISIDGATVCYTHGGAAPHVRAAARARIENASYNAAGEMIRLGLHAESESVRVQANKEVLDRGGVTVPTQIQIGPTPAYQEIFDEILGGSRQESRQRRGYVEDEYSAGNYEDLRPTTEPRLGRYSPAWTEVSEVPQNEPSDPRRGDLSGNRDRSDGRNVRHNIGDDALKIAADLARMRELER